MNVRTTFVIAKDKTRANHYLFLLKHNVCHNIGVEKNIAISKKKREEELVKLLLYHNQQKREENKLFVISEPTTEEHGSSSEVLCY